MTSHNNSSAATEYVLMPREATRAMTMAGCDSLPSCEHVFGHAGEMLRNAYRRMVEAGRITDVAQSVGMRAALEEIQKIGGPMVARIARDALASQPSPAATVGFFANLTPEQQKAALEYDGPENHGDPAYARSSAGSARDAFENWWMSRGKTKPSRSTETGCADQYAMANAEMAWRGWQAALTSTEPQSVRETDAYRDTVKKIAAVREKRLAELVEENAQLRADLAKKRPETLTGKIAEVYGELDAEDCAMIDREWARMRGYILPSNGTSSLTRPAPQTAREQRQAERRERTGLDVEEAMTLEEDCGCIGAVIGQHERSCPLSRPESK